MIQQCRGVISTRKFLHLLHSWDYKVKYSIEEGNSTGWQLWYSSLMEDYCLQAAHHNSPCGVPHVQFLLRGCSHLLHPWPDARFQDDFKVAQVWTIGLTCMLLTSSENMIKVQTHTHERYKQYSLKLSQPNTLDRSIVILYRAPTRNNKCTHINNYSNGIAKRKKNS